MDASEFRSQEGSEGGEATESMGVRALEEATFEPAACLEGMGDYQQAEAIQTRLTAIVDNLVTQTSEESVVVGAKGEVGDCPIPIPHPAEEIGWKIDERTQPAGETGYKEQVGTLPVPLPHPAEEIGWKGYRKEPGSVETPLPGTGGETGYKVGEGEVPGEADLASSAGGVAGSGAEQVGITPINLPREADLASSAGGVAGSGAEQVGITPINLPREADLASSAGGVAGSGAEQVGITPINLPREADLASSSGGVAGSGAEQVGITPINLPREANVVSNEAVGEQGGSEVATGGLKGPGGDGVASGAVKGPGGDGVAEGTVRGSGGGDPAGGVGWKGSGDIPISLRSNVAGSGEPESASGRQQEMPREGPYAPAQAENTGEGSYVTPINLPLPNPGNIAVDGGGIKLSSKEPGAVEIPLTGTGAESMVKNEIGWKTGEGKGPAEAVEIPLPGITGEGGLTEEAAIEQVIVRTEAALGEMSESFNLQYLMLQNKIAHENRQFSMPSNILKTDHDTAKNSINNIR